VSTVAPDYVHAASFQLTWVDNSQDEDGFNIERKLNTNGTFSLLATVGPDVTSFSDGNLSDNTTYCYRVNAFNSAGNSAYTNEACGTTPTVPPPPSGNAVSTNIANGAVLSGSSVVWTATSSGSPVRLEFFIDGALSWTENFSPYQFNGDPSGTLDTKTLSNGSHQLKVRATYSNNSTAEQAVTITVSNGVTNLAATPATGSTFAGLSGAGCSDGTVTMDASKSCAAASQTATNQLITRIGVFRPDTGEWFLDRTGNGQWDGCVLDTCISLFGQAGDLPVIGSWSGAGTSNIGTFNQTRGIWQLDRNGNGQWDGCALDTCISLFGQPGELPVTREISGFNGTIIGTFQPQQGLWKFDLNGNNTFDSCSIDECDENFGTPGDVPVVGYWISSGTKNIGIFRPSTGEWFLDVNGNGQWDGCGVDKCIEQFGDDGDLPVVGDWNGTGEARIGVFRPSTGEWFLDMNGNGKFDGCAVDACLGPFGAPGDWPAVGKW
jgi:hypothetical protein